MKTLIKKYEMPKVDKKILKNVFLKKQRKENKLLIILWIIFSILFLLFLESLFLLNLSYFDLLISSFMSVNFYFLLFLNLLIWIIYFVFNNLVLIGGSLFLSYILFVFTSTQKWKIN